MDMKNTTKKYIFCIGILVIALVVSVVVSINHLQGKEVAQVEEKSYYNLVSNGKSYKYNSSIVSILLLGIDVEDENVKQGQADVIHLLLLDRKQKKMKVVAIPRDSMCDIRMFDVEGNDLGWHRQHLNLAYAYGDNPESGCMYTSQAVSRLFNGIPMNYYAAIDLNSIKEIHEVVGTLKVKVPNQSLVNVNSKWYKGGTAVLTSENVEKFLRTRNVHQDFSNEPRMERQKNYLLAYYKKFKENLDKDFDNIMQKMYTIIDNVTSNISYSDMENFANMILEYDFNDKNDYFIVDGQNQSGDYHDEFELDEKSLHELTKSLFYIEEEN